MQQLTITDFDLEKLVRLGDLLIPANEKFPRFGAVPEIGALLHRSASACGHTAKAIDETLDAIGEIRNMDDARQFSEAKNDHFGIASTIVAGAYYMSPQILQLMNYPVDHSHPAEMEDFANEYETGIVEPVISRGPCYVNPPEKQELG